MLDESGSWSNHARTQARAYVSSQHAIRKTVAAIETKITCLARFCCLETSDRLSGNGKSRSKNANGRGKRGVEAEC
jgi:hypothetical protein